MGIEDEQVSDVKQKIRNNDLLPALTSYQGPTDNVDNYRFWGVTVTATQDANKVKVILEYRYHQDGVWREFDSFYVSNVPIVAGSVDRIYRVTREEYRARLDNESPVSSMFVDLGYVRGGN